MFNVFNISKDHGILKKPLVFSCAAHYHGMFIKSMRGSGDENKVGATSLFVCTVCMILWKIPGHTILF